MNKSISFLDVDMLPPGQSLALSHRSPSCEVSWTVFVSLDLPSLPSQVLQPKRGLDWRRSFPRFLALPFSPSPHSRPTSSRCLRVHPDLYFWASFFFFSASLLSPPLLLPRIFLLIPPSVLVDLRSLCLLFLTKLSFNKYYQIIRGVKYISHFSRASAKNATGSSGLVLAQSTRTSVRVEPRVVCTLGRGL